MSEPTLGEWRNTGITGFARGRWRVIKRIDKRWMAYRVNPGFNDLSKKDVRYFDTSDSARAWCDEQEAVNG